MATKSNLYVVIAMPLCCAKCFDILNMLPLRRVVHEKQLGSTSCELLAQDKRQLAKHNFLHTKRTQVPCLKAGGVGGGQLEYWSTDLIDCSFLACITLNTCMQQNREKRERLTDCVCFQRLPRYSQMLRISYILHLSRHRFLKSSSLESIKSKQRQ